MWQSLEVMLKSSGWEAGFQNLSHCLPSTSAPICVLSPSTCSPYLPFFIGHWTPEFLRRDSYWFKMNEIMEHWTCLWPGDSNRSFSLWYFIHTHSKTDPLYTLTHQLPLVVLLYLLSLGPAFQRVGATIKWRLQRCQHVCTGTLCSWLNRRWREGSFREGCTPGLHTSCFTPSCGAGSTLLSWGCSHLSLFLTCILLLTQALFALTELASATLMHV